eukprot:GHVH01016441.1.p1 GENE.GHVH01016441.1~~GHVH01016441.1.p1  ORF type:complete len:911 (+),score=140.48 GHVH01016441.1:85-2817(+)
MNSVICDAKYSRVTNLQRSECVKRESVVSHVCYLAEFTLPRGDYYYGYVTIRFDMDLDRFEDEELMVDFKGYEISQVVVNYADLTKDIKFNDHGIYIPKASLLNDGNTVCVAYKNEYTHNGCGLHSYVDPSDDEQYVYTFFEAHYGHEVMPLFDQPNIKASCTFVLNVVDSWTMISNENVREATLFTDRSLWKDSLPHSILSNGEFDQKSGIKRWQFFATPKLSTYLYTFCGGAYDEVEGPSDLVCPMKLYFRKSVAQWISEDYSSEWFAASNHATRFFEDYMNVEYPYSKMDHVIVPEFNMGAMEQVGCITYTEKYLFKVPPSRSRRINVTNTIMHEIAHQWFGNLITMNWWDDLWLNEAFATFMSCVAQESYVDTKGVLTGQEAWLYLVDDAVWGLREDQEDQTHPISCTAKDTVEAEAIFDGISYGKGSAFLKTWCHFVGSEVFKHGVRDYFSRYMGGNASLCHFVRTQDEASNLEVTSWANDWLMTKGAMEVRVTYSVDPATKLVTEFKVVQGFCKNSDKVFKSHRMDVVFFYSEGDQLRKEMKTVFVDANAATSVDCLNGLKAPDAVLVNSSYHVYCKAINDVSSNEFLLANYHKMDDVIDRYCFIIGLVNLIRDGEFPALSFLRSFEHSLIHEKVAFLKESYLKFAVEMVEYVSEGVYERYVAKLYSVLRLDLTARVKEAEAKGVVADQGECVTSLVSHILSLLGRSTPILQADGLEILKSSSLCGVTLADTQKMQVLALVASLESMTQADRVALIASTLDPMGQSGDVESCKRSCSAAAPDLAEKERIFSILLEAPSDVSQEAYGDYASHFLSVRQPHLASPFVERYYENVLKIHNEKSHFLAEKFFHSLLPSRVFREDETVMTRLQEIGSDADLMFKRNVAATVDRDTRRIKARTLTDESLW